MEMTDEQTESRYSAEFKQDAVSRMGQGGKTVTALAEELGVRRKLFNWLPACLSLGVAVHSDP